MMRALNLFGEMQEIKDPDKGSSPYIRFKKEYQYREATDKLKSCKTCAHCFRKGYHNKTYYKCEFMGNTGSGATDIRLKMTCNKWEESHF